MRQLRAAIAKNQKLLNRMLVRAEELHIQAHVAAEAAHERKIKLARSRRKFRLPFLLFKNPAP